MRKLKGRARVVVHAAHQAVVDGKRDFRGCKKFLHLGKVRAATFIQVVGHTRQLLDDRLVLRHFAVEHAQRIGDRAALAVRAHGVDHVFQRVTQRLQIDWTVIGAADGVQLQAPALNAQTVEQRSQHLQQFGIDGGRFAASGGWANHLSTDLVELAVTPFLGTLTAKLGTDVIEALQARPLPQFVFDISANNTRRVLGPKGQPLAFFALRARALFTGKSLFRDNLALFAHGALKQLQVFDDRRANFLKVVDAEDIADRGLDKVPRFGLRRKQIAGAADGFDHLIHV